MCETMTAAILLIGDNGCGIEKPYRRDERESQLSSLERRDRSGEREPIIATSFFSLGIFEYSGNKN